MLRSGSRNSSKRPNGPDVSYSSQGIEKNKDMKNFWSLIPGGVILAAGIVVMMVKK
jgi:hypothetical protein